MVIPLPRYPPFFASSATRPIRMCSGPTSGRFKAFASCCASITALMARSVNFSNTAVTTSAPRACEKGRKRNAKSDERRNTQRERLKKNLRAIVRRGARTSRFRSPARRRAHFERVLERSSFPRAGDASASGDATCAGGTHLDDGASASEAGGACARFVGVEV